MLLRRDARRSRSVVLVACAAILAGEILASFLIDCAPLEIRFPAAAKVISSLQHANSANAIWFFGSSRTANNIDPEVVSHELQLAGVGDSFSVDNVSIAAGDAVVMEFVADKLLATGIRPSVAIIEALPETLSERNSWLNFHLARQYRWPEAWQALPDAYRSGKLSDLIATRFYPVYLFRGEFQRWVLEALNLQFEAENSEKLKKRAVKGAPSPESADLVALERGAARVRSMVRDYRIGGLSVRALEGLISRYRKLGITVIMISPPVSTPYRERLYREPINAAYFAYLERLRENYGTYFFDYRHRLPDQYFYTIYYTTISGKAYFSRLLAREVLVPLLAAKAGTR
jgi:hypothetical protein